MSVRDMGELALNISVRTLCWRSPAMFPVWTESHCTSWLPSIFLEAADMLVPQEWMVDPLHSRHDLPELSPALGS